MEKILIEKNTAGDSRVAKGIPTISDFDHANQSHREDVRRLAQRFSVMLKESGQK